MTPSVRKVKTRKADGRPNAQKWAAWRNRQREIVKRRSWRCESVVFCTEMGVNVHHTFGRIEEPWASSYLLSLNLCFMDHGRAHSDARYRDQLRLLALTRMALFLAPKSAEVRALVDNMIRTYPPRATYDWLINMARSAGIQPPDWKE